MQINIHVAGEEKYEWYKKLIQENSFILRGLVGEKIGPQEKESFDDIEHAATSKGQIENLFCCNPWVALIKYDSWILCYIIVLREYRVLI